MALDKKKAYTVEIIVLAVLAVAIFIILKYTKQDTTRYYHAYFSEVQGLQASSPVKINGVRVGKISDIGLNDSNWVRITLAVKEDIPLPVGTVASLASGGMTGEKIINLEPGKGPGVLAEDAVILTSFDTSVLPLSVRIKPMMETAKMILSSADVGLRGFNYLINAGLATTTASALISIDKQTSKLSNITTKLNNDPHLTQSIESAYRKTAEMAANGPKTERSIRDMEQGTAKMANTQTAANIQKLQKNLSALGNSLRRLKADTVAGKFLYNPDIYRNANKSLDTMNKGLKKLYDNPTGITIFGGNK